MADAADVPDADEVVGWERAVDNAATASAFPGGQRPRAGRFLPA